MVCNINNYYAHYFKNVFAHKLYYYANVAGSFLFLSKQLSCSEDTNAVLSDIQHVHV